ncbi:c-type cytochrome [Photobacterium sanguinicancri]|uniref:c-type cytochrome n=1 Tax=Photobacterium sanguinicancri TaxID=875932 RepID=UPI003D0D81F3
MRKRMKKKVCALVLLPLVISLPVLAKAGIDSYDQAIVQRQTAFSSIESDLKTASKSIDGQDSDWQQLVLISEQLADHSKALMTLFPEGSQSGSKAKKEVWNKPEKFNVLLAQMDTGFQQMYQASEQQNLNELKAGLSQAEKTCRGCHRSYRARF